MDRLENYLDLTYIDDDTIKMTVSQCLSLMLDTARSITSYKDIHVSKLPSDCWSFQEIIYERKPTVIIEIGNRAGGSTVMLRDFLKSSDIVGAKYVIGIDVDRSMLSVKALNAPDIEWVDGNAGDERILAKVKSLISEHDRVMVIDDSTHEYFNTLELLRMYSPLVTKDQYFIVEDTAIGEFFPTAGGELKNKKRAYAAVQEFMSDNDKFEVDRTREKFFITLNPEGYLEKIR